VETIFSTDQVHPRERYDYWHSVACKKIVDHDSVPEDRLNFDASIELGTLGNLGLVRFHNSPMRVSHTLTHVAQVESDRLFVCFQVEGAVFIMQNGREVTLEAGTLTLVDPMLSYDCTFFRGSKLLVLKVPRRELRARLGRNLELITRLVTPARVDDSLALSLTAMLPSLAGKMSTVTEEMVGNHAVDLISLSIARTMESDAVRISCPKTVLLARLRAVIEARLTNPHLDAREVADAVGISVRYANELFFEQDTSIRRLIIARRLGRCRDALEDATQFHRTVSDIAYGWGFSDMTHFGRRFKETYGILPSECRILARQSAERASL
jgi:AraC family transcriptional activator of tynA and feaB